MAEDTEVDEVDAIAIYLSEMAQTPLLDHTQAMALGQQIEAGRRTQERPAAAAQAGQEAQRALVRANTRLVVSVAKRYIGFGVSFADLIQEGNVGLIVAASKYDWRRGYRFSTYATWWIRQAVTRSLAQQGRTIRLPVHQYEMSRKVRKVQYRLMAETGAPAAVADIAAELGWTEARVVDVLLVSQDLSSLDTVFDGQEEDDEGESNLYALIQDDAATAEAQTAKAMLAEKLLEVLEQLEAREAMVLRLRFGLLDGQTYTLEEVGQKFQLTRERIRQIEAQALRKLRHPRYARRLREFVE